jgi:hypothetical protein
MKRLMGWLVLIAAIVCLQLGHVSGQNTALDPAFSMIKLKAGFDPDPHSIPVEAGGPITTKLGGVNAFVSSAPDVRLHYTAGTPALTFYVKSKADTTLLINLPDGSWLADDDSGGGLNPQIRLATPKAGRYDIWVGTAAKAPAKAALYITERK